MTSRVGAVAIALLFAALLLPAASAGPGNDNFSSAVAVNLIGSNGVGAYYNEQTTLNAGLQAGEPRPCGNMDATVWYTFRAVQSGLLSIGTDASTFDTVVALYEGTSLGGLDPVTCSDNFGNDQGRVAVAVTGGRDYAIQIGGYDGDAGTLAVNVVFAAVTATGSMNMIQPGDSLGGFCTLNFVFDGPGGAVYIGTAAHCVDNGDGASTTGYPGFGTVVYDGNDNNARTDIALIAVHPVYKPFVSGEVLGHPGMPSGFTTSGETFVGDLILGSGYGAGVDVTDVTREKRVSVLMSDNSQTYTLNGLVMPGDSGGPFLHMDTGKAMGIVSRFNVVALPPTTDVGPTVQGLLLQLQAMQLTLRTA